jgi:hypothetical protein
MKSWLTTTASSTSANETRGQTLQAERAWGEFPIQFVGEEPDEAADVPPHRELLKGMLIGFALAAVGAIVGITAGTAFYFKFYQ